jgi:Spy/CpxP family protein refolding chaperone
MSIARTMALGALMVVGVAGVSAAQTATAPRTRADSGSVRHRDRAAFRRGNPGFAFGRDLNLTDTQKAQIKAIRQKYQPQNEALRAQAKPYVDAARAARQKGDTAAFRSNMLKARQAGESVRTQEMSEIRAVLTPDQQAKWDARQKAAADHRGKAGKKGWTHKNGAAIKPASK